MLTMAMASDIHAEQIHVQLTGDDHESLVTNDIDTIIIIFCILEYSRSMLCISSIIIYAARVFIRALLDGYNHSVIPSSNP